MTKHFSILRRCQDITPQALPSKKDRFISHFHLQQNLPPESISILFNDLQTAEIERIKEAIKKRFTRKWTFQQKEYSATIDLGATNASRDGSHRNMGRRYQAAQSFFFCRGLLFLKGGHQCCLCGPLCCSYLRHLRLFFLCCQDWRETRKWKNSNSFILTGGLKIAEWTKIRPAEYISTHYWRFNRSRICANHLTVSCMYERLPGGGNRWPDLES